MTGTTSTMGMIGRALLPGSCQLPPVGNTTSLPRAVLLGFVRMSWVSWLSWLSWLTWLTWIEVSVESFGTLSTLSRISRLSNSRAMTRTTASMRMTASTRMTARTTTCRNMASKLNTSTKISPGESCNPLARILHELDSNLSHSKRNPSDMALHGSRSRAINEREAQRNGNQDSGRGLNMQVERPSDHTNLEQFEQFVKSITATSSSRRMLWRRPSAMSFSSLDNSCGSATTLSMEATNRNAPLIRTLENNEIDETNRPRETNEVDLRDAHEGRQDGRKTGGLSAMAQRVRRFCTERVTPAKWRRPYSLWVPVPQSLLRLLPRKFRISRMLLKREQYVKKIQRKQRGQQSLPSQVGTTDVHNLRKVQVHNECNGFKTTHHESLASNDIVGDSMLDDSSTSGPTIISQRKQQRRKRHRLSVTSNKPYSEAPCIEYNEEIHDHSQNACLSGNSHNNHQSNVTSESHSNKPYLEAPCIEYNEEIRDNPQNDCLSGNSHNDQQSNVPSESHRVSRMSSTTHELLRRFRMGRLSQHEREAFFHAAISSGGTVNARQPAVISDPSLQTPKTTPTGTTTTTVHTDASIPELTVTESASNISNTNIEDNHRCFEKKLVLHDNPTTDTWIETLVHSCPDYFSSRQVETPSKMELMNASVTTNYNKDVVWISNDTCYSRNDDNSRTVAGQEIQGEVCIGSTVASTILTTVVCTPDPVAHRSNNSDHQRRLQMVSRQDHSANETSDYLHQRLNDHSPHFRNNTRIMNSAHESSSCTPLCKTSDTSDSKLVTGNIQNTDSQNFVGCTVHYMDNDMAEPNWTTMLEALRDQEQQSQPQISHPYIRLDENKRKTKSTISNAIGISHDNSDLSKRVMVLKINKGKLLDQQQQQEQNSHQQQQRNCVSSTTTKTSSCSTTGRTTAYSNITNLGFPTSFSSVSTKSMDKHLPPRISKKLRQELLDHENLLSIRKAKEKKKILDSSVALAIATTRVASLQVTTTRTTTDQNSNTTITTLKNNQKLLRP